MNRREFIVKSSAAAVAIAVGGFPLSAMANNRNKGSRITILHTNDMHSRIEAFPADDPKYAGKGGMAARASLIQKIRKEETDILLLDSGDVFQGTAYFNFFGGELEFKLMSEMGYDAGTLGNHDFDNGVDGLIRQLPNATFPILNANYDFSDSPLLPHVKPYQIFERAGKKIGVFGIGIELSGLVPDQLFGSIRYRDPILYANQTASELKEQGCDLIICLSHLGWRYDSNKVSDVVLAEQSQHIDIILGGHTHTFFPQPYEFRNADGNPVIVNQVGWAGLMLGRIDVEFNDVDKTHLWRSSVHWIEPAS